MVGLNKRIKMVVDKINKFLSSKDFTLNESIKYEVEKLSGYSFQRQFMQDNEKSPEKTLRLSSAGKCPRQQAYKYHGYEPAGKEIDSRAKIIFWVGDLIELTVVELARLAGVPLFATGFRQLTVEFSVDDTIIKGHPDGIILDKSGTTLLEVKSMSDYGFKNFEKGIIDDGYIAQANTYMSVLDIKQTVFVAINKNNSVIEEKIVKRDDKIVKNIINNFRNIINTTKDDLPPRAFEPGKKDFYPWNCLYCPYWKHCIPNAEKVLVGKSYKLKVKKEKK